MTYGNGGGVRENNTIDINFEQSVFHILFYMYIV